MPCRAVCAPPPSISPAAARLRQQLCGRIGAATPPGRAPCPSASPTAMRRPLNPDPLVFFSTRPSAPARRDWGRDVLAARIAQAWTPGRRPAVGAAAGDSRRSRASRRCTGRLPDGCVWPVHARDGLNVGLLLREAPSQTDPRCSASFRFSASRRPGRGWYGRRSPRWATSVLARAPSHRPRRRPRGRSACACSVPCTSRWA